MPRFLYERMNGFPLGSHPLHRPQAPPALSLEHPVPAGTRMAAESCLERMCLSLLCMPIQPSRCSRASPPGVTFPQTSMTCPKMSLSPPGPVFSCVYCCVKICETPVYEDTDWRLGLQTAAY